MSKLSKEEEARRAGMAYALKIAKEGGIEALENEIKYRNITRAPLAIPRSEMEKFCNEVKVNCVYTFRLMTMLTLHDEFDFGTQRLRRFMDRFMLKTECLTDDYATWKDYADILEEECKIKIDIPEMFLTEGRDD